MCVCVCLVFMDNLSYRSQHYFVLERVCGFVPVIFNLVKIMSSMKILIALYNTSCCDEEEPKTQYWTPIIFYSQDKISR